MMTKYQDHPEEPAEAKEVLKQRIRAIDESTKPVERLFWKCLVAFNLILGSLVFWYAVLRSV
jgi:hypothetical protein